jgi:DNA gyrase subunit A
MVTEGGQAIRFAEDEVRVMGRQASGVNAIRLMEEDRCAGMDVIKPEHTHILVVTRNGYGKRTPVAEYPVRGRYGQGIRTVARNERTGPIVAMRCINAVDEIMLVTRGGVMLRTSLNQIRETSRSTQGVTLINVGEDDEVVGIAILKFKEGMGDSASATDSAPASDAAAAPNGHVASESG